MKNDHLLIYLIEHKKNITYRDKIILRRIKMDNPSYVESDEVKYELYKRRYIIDESDWESTQDEYGGFTSRPLDKPEIISTSLLGEKAIYTRELKSETTEDFFDKTFVRIGLVIGSLMGFLSFMINIFRYIKDNWMN
ncbi:hypothetical protein OF897_13030 [Chryseobacterium formosus]|uniref:Uncharacterized protein n=1 Tax=Chryseobacterium formosus TaxID=1537363 RepID=A0ABT3XT42_9FLAO|nr:hypothetical protein [Chryseobacterium formosus]MCX8524837.1 hypothetical protein [Chryseobacterium formosus]